MLENHEHESDALQDASFSTTCVVALYASDPPLVLRHLPLRRVPPTAVNVHGHIHGAEAASQRHFNVSVERTGATSGGASRSRPTRAAR